MSHNSIEFKLVGHRLLCCIVRDEVLSIQIDEVTDCSGTGQLIAYVRHAEDTTIIEDMLFCTPIK